MGGIHFHILKGRTTEIRRVGSNMYLFEKFEGLPRQKYIGWPKSQFTDTILLPRFNIDNIDLQYSWFTHLLVLRWLLFLLCKFDLITVLLTVVHFAKALLWYPNFSIFHS